MTKEEWEDKQNSLKKKYEYLPTKDKGKVEKKEFTSTVKVKPIENEKEKSVNVFGEKVGKKYLVGGSADLPIDDKTKVRIGYDKIIGDESEGKKSINLSRQIGNGGEISLGYNSNKDINASYVTPKGNSFSARYNPNGGGMVSARINLNKRKNK